MKRKDEERLTFICECGDISDLILMRFWSDDVEEEDYPSVYVSYHLNKFSFWKRIWVGIRYIFGYTTKWGQFGEIILEPEDWEKVEKVRDYLKKVLDTRNGTINRRKGDEEPENLNPNRTDKPLEKIEPLDIVKYYAEYDGEESEGIMIVGSFDVGDGKMPGSFPRAIYGKSHIKGTYYGDFSPAVSEYYKATPEDIQNFFNGAPNGPFNNFDRELDYYFSTYPELHKRYGMFYETSKCNTCEEVPKKVKKKVQRPL